MPTMETEVTIYSSSSMTSSRPRTAGMTPAGSCLNRREDERGRNKDDTKQYGRP